jgi:dynein heavy chain
MEQHKKTWKIKGTDTIFAVLEDNMGILSTQKTGLFYENFKDEIETWENNLQKVSETLEMLAQVQRQWIYLEAIFASQQDQDRQLIGDINKFGILNNRISVHMDRIKSKPNILTALLVDNFYNDLDDISKRLDESQKVLFSLLETKRGAFPRFYFLANDDLFELLGNSRDPGKVNKHIKKCFEGIKKLSIASTPIPGKKADNFNFDVMEIISPEEETVKLVNKIPIENGVEFWLKQTEKQMR